MLTPRNIPLVILGHLALSGCSKSEPAPNAPAPTTSSTTPASTTAAKTPSAAGGPCKTNDDCVTGKDLFCHLDFNGASFSGDGGVCQPGRPIYEGRPLVIDETSARHLASHVVGSTSWMDAIITDAGAPAMDDAVRAEYIQYFAEAALEEHASIAAFARTICELMALGAPATLLRKTQAALADEITHAEACFSWLATLGEKPVGASALPAAVAPFQSGEATGLNDLKESLLRDVLIGGCIGETLAACRAAEKSLSQKTPHCLRLFFDQIASDEARHAALAFETARWLLTLESRAQGDDRTLHRIVDEEITLFKRIASPADRASLDPLFSVFLREQTCS